MSPWVGHTPLRGEVWDTDLEVGRHPTVVLSRNALNERLSSLAVVVVTGTPGPDATHVSLGADAGLTGYDESYANVTDIRSVLTTDVVNRRGLCSDGEIQSIESRLRVYLGL